MRYIDGRTELYSSPQDLRFLSFARALLNFCTQGKWLIVHTYYGRAIEIVCMHVGWVLVNRLSLVTDLHVWAAHVAITFRSGVIKSQLAGT